MEKREQLYDYADGEAHKGKTVSEIFNDIYQNRLWDVEERQTSVSGIGSTLAQTGEIIRQLPLIIKQSGVRSLLDVPCGDFFWMRQVDLDGVHYTGADIVAGLVKTNQEQFANENRSFLQLDLIKDIPPRHDLVFCRDCLVHLSFEHIFAALRNIAASGATWLMTTTFTRHDDNQDIPTGGWRPLNFEKAPFHFPPPVLMLDEKCTEMDGAFNDKSLGLWKLEAWNYELQSPLFL
jgi:hypothetical protein